MANSPPTLPLTWGVSFAFTFAGYLYVENTQSSFNGIAMVQTVTGRFGYIRSRAFCLPSFGVTNVCWLPTLSLTRGVSFASTFAGYIYVENKQRFIQWDRDGANRYRALRLYNTGDMNPVELMALSPGTCQCGTWRLKRKWKLDQLPCAILALL